MRGQRVPRGRGAPGRRRGRVQNRRDRGIDRCRWVRRGAEVNHDDGGRAIIEVVFLAVLLLIPTVYLLAFILRIQAATFAVGQAARDAGRIIDASPRADVGVARAHEIARIALNDQHVSTDEMHLRFVQPGANCTTGPEVTPTLDPGVAYDICVIATITLPGVPTAISGMRNTVSGVYPMHVGEFREGSD